MGQIAILPNSASVEAAWERYRVLAAALVRHPQLAANRVHMEKMVRAEREWKQAFLAMEDGR